MKHKINQCDSLVPTKRLKFMTTDDGECKVDQMDANELDIGNFANTAKELGDDMRMRLLEQHWKLSSSFVFPRKKYGVKKVSYRQFNFKWLDRWGWLAYSRKFDGAFCAPCVLFGHESGHNGQKLTKLYKEPLQNWQSAVCRLDDHNENSNFHKTSMLRAMNFRKVIQGKSEAIDQQLDRMLNARVECNRKILASVMETVVLSGKQNISLRGHRDDSQYYDSKNPCNFQALLDFRISAGDNVLKKHFETAPKNATYRSKTIQNKLITICGHQIEQCIKEEVEQCRFFSILADEASDCRRKSKWLSLSDMWLQMMK